jgi:DNA-binding GntR family transcriptional regulator
MRDSEIVEGGLGMRRLVNAEPKAQDTFGLMSMCGRAYDFIKQRIVTNETSVGDQVNDREIAEQLGIRRWKSSGR